MDPLYLHSILHSQSYLHIVFYCSSKQLSCANNFYSDQMTTLWSREINSCWLNGEFEKAPSSPDLLLNVRSFRYYIEVGSH